MKSLAKEQIRGKIWILFASYVIVFFISGVLVSVSRPRFVNIGSVLDAIIAPAFQIGIIMIFLKLANDGVKPKVEDVFKGFNIFGKALWLDVITSVFVFLWSLLFFVPGIIKGISYSMAPYILSENQSMTAREAINESKRIMEGHKMDAFVLGLSFIGWIFLVAITLGFAGIYVIPYIQATFVNFYNFVKMPLSAERNMGVEL